MNLILVDGSNFAYRSFYSHRLLKTSEGENTGVLFGAAHALLFMRHRYPDHGIIFCWDGPGKTWRHVIMERLYGLDSKPAEVTSSVFGSPGKPVGYKANRIEANQSEERKEVLRQIPIFQKWLMDIGLHQIYVPHVEADDVVGIFSKFLTDQGHHILIHSSDQDFYQLVSEQVRILAKVRENVIIDVDTITNQFGLVPTQWPKVRALCGDSSDNLPGLPRVGLVTAIKYFHHGLDAGKKLFTDLPLAVQHEYVRFEQYWPQIKRVYQLSYIPRILDSRFLPQTWQRVEHLQRILEELPGRLPGTQQRYESFFHYMSRWELTSLLGQKSDYWKFL